MGTVADVDDVSPGRACIRDRSRGAIVGDFRLRVPLAVRRIADRRNKYVTRRAARRHIGLHVSNIGACRPCREVDGLLRIGGRAFVNEPNRRIAANVEFRGNPEPETPALARRKKAD